MPRPLAAFAGSLAPLRLTRQYDGCPGGVALRRPHFWPHHMTAEPDSLRPSTASQSDSLRQPHSLSRRDALSLIAAASVSPALIAFPSQSRAFGPDSESEGRPPAALVLPSLPYQYNALEPAIDRETMILHHDKHFAKYMEGANAALAKVPGGTALVEGDPAKLADLLGNLDSIKDEYVRQALRNNGGGYVCPFRRIYLQRASRANSS
jgi:Iron/manganese superoxide dismutases, alpha-hairpin domain